MRILVTGSSGRLGRRVVQVATEMGHEVVPVDVAPPQESQGPPTHMLDLTRYEGLREVMEGVDAVCHLGNFPGFGVCGRSVGYINNTASTYNVYLAADEAGVRRVVYASSIQAYGVLSGAIRQAVRRRHATPVYLPVDEEHPLCPVEAYPLSKVTGELIGRSFCDQQGDRTAWSLRLSGVRDVNYKWKKDLPPAERPPLLGSLYTWIHVDDAARAVVLAAQTERPGHHAVNIVAPTSAWPWSEELLEQVYGRVPAFRRPLAPTEALIDGRRAGELLGFHPARTLDEME